jgi:hypothetical protein
MEVTTAIRPMGVSFERAAELTSLSQNSLRRLAKRGTLRTTVVGKRRIIPVSALYQLVENGRSQPKQE